MVEQGLTGEEGFQAGDTVLIANHNDSYSEVKIKAVWKDGRILLTNGHVYRPDGWPYTRKASGRLVRATDELLAQARQQAADLAVARAERSVARAEKAEADKREQEAKLAAVRAAYGNQVAAANELQPGLWQVNVLAENGPLVTFIAAVSPDTRWDYGRKDGLCEVACLAVRVTVYFQRPDGSRWSISNHIDRQYADWHEAVYEFLVRLTEYGWY